MFYTCRAFSGFLTFRACRSPRWSCHLRIKRIFATMNTDNWFESWFDTPYYHLLYRNRNDAEAALFIQNLLSFLRLKPGSRVLDLACGKGRHSLQLNKSGLQVVGADLSKNNISEARKLENDDLRFIVHDMRKPIQGQEFDAVFNLFTSFGYFPDTSDNLQVIGSVHEMLKKDGLFVIDFMNSARAVEKLVAHESKTLDGIHFEIERKYDGRHIYKFIRFTDRGRDYEFMERVQALTREDFMALLGHADFRVLHTFGDFRLNAYDEQKSDRLILIAQK